MPAYIPHIAGNFEGGDVVFGHRLKARLPAKRVPEAVERWIRNYEEKRNDGENFNAFVDRTGFDAVRGADLGPEAAGRVQLGQPSVLHRMEPLGALQGRARRRGVRRLDGRARNRTRRGPTAELDALGFDPEGVAADLEDASAEEALGWALETFSPRMYIACSFQKRAR